MLYKPYADYGNCASQHQSSLIQLHALHKDLIGIPSPTMGGPLTPSASTQTFELEEDESVYMSTAEKDESLHGSQLLFMLITLTSASFLVLIDASIIAPVGKMNGRTPAQKKHLYNAVH